MCYCHTEAEKESSGDKHFEVDTDGLEGNTHDHDQTANENTKSATNQIWDVTNNWDGGKRTDCHDAVEETEERTFGIVEVLLPIWQSLQAVHHGTIVAISSRS